MTAQEPARLATGGRIDRSVTWRFTMDGREFTGHPGDTLASALLANGQLRAGNSLYEDRPRGIMAAGVEEPNALVKVAPRFPGHVAESMLPATTVSLVDGLSAELLNGLGKLDPNEDQAEYDKKYVHNDVLVIAAELHRIVDEIADSALQLTAQSEHRRGATIDADLDAVPAERVGRHALRDLTEIDHGALLDVGRDTRQLHELTGQRREFAGLGDDRTRGLSGIGSTQPP